MYRIEILPLDQIEPYLSFTFPYYREQIEQGPQQGKWIAIGAAEHTTPVGLALAAIDGDCGNLVSLYVNPQQRRQKVGTRLMEALEEAIQEMGCRSLSLNYTTKRATAANLESILTQLNWPLPTCQMFFCEYDMLALQHPPFAEFQPLAHPFTLFPFDAITDAEKTWIQDHCGTLFPRELDPLRDRENLESLNSIGLRFQNELIGWIVTHRISLETIRYTSLFVKPAFRPKGVAIALMAEAVRKQFLCRELAPRALHGTYVTADAMMRVIHKRLLPFTDQHYFSKSTTKSF